MSEVNLKVTTGVMLELNDYNRMRKADMLVKLEDQTIIVLVNGLNRIAMAVPAGTQFYQLAHCCARLFNLEYEISTNMRTVDSVIHEAGRSLKDDRILDGSALFYIPIMRPILEK